MNQLMLLKIGNWVITWAMQLNILAEQVEKTIPKLAKILEKLSGILLDLSNKLKAKEQNKNGTNN